MRSFFGDITAIAWLRPEESAQPQKKTGGEEA
jgi:hypothetical protein